MGIDVRERRAAWGHGLNEAHCSVASVTYMACHRHPALEPTPVTFLIPNSRRAERPCLLVDGAGTDFEFTFSDFAMSLINKFYQLTTMESSHWLLCLKGQRSELRG